MAAAARLTDPIGHSPTMSWLLTGLLVGAAIGVAVAATVATGGLAAVAIVGGAAAGGAGLMEFASTLSVAPKEQVGVITTPGSGNVFTNSLRAARAHLDAAVCSKHPAPATIATGSGTVYINGMPAARVDDKTICSAVVTAGSDNVYIGGPTMQTDEIHPENLVPGWVHVALFVVGTGCALVLAAPAVVVGGLALGIVGGIGGSWAGGQIFGEGSDGQKLMGLAGALVGGFLGAKGGSALMSSRAAAPGTADDALATADDALATADDALAASKTLNSLDDLNALRGTGDSVGDMRGMSGQSIPDIVKNIPEGATVRKLSPAEGGSQVGLEYKWVDQNGVTNRLRVHDPDPSAGPGSNSAEGWTGRWQSGKKYYDPVEGDFRHANVHNEASPHYDPAAANNTHIPVKTPEPSLIDLMRYNGGGN